MITCFVGMPGEGKTYCLTHWLYKQMKRGRLGFSQYAVNNAYPLGRLYDLLHDRAIGAAVAIDEVGRILPARDWSNEDEIEQLVFEIHRHHGLDIGIACQSPMQISTSLRRLVGEWKYPKRVGRDPSELLKAGKVPKWYQRPLCFRIDTYYPDPTSEAGLPKIVMEKKDAEGNIKESVPVEHSWTWYRQEVAEMYCTLERIYTDGIRLELEERLKGAEDRLFKGGKWVVEEGHASGTETLLQRARDDKDIRRRSAARKRGLTVRAEPEQTIDVAYYLNSLQGEQTQTLFEANTVSGTTTGSPNGQASDWMD